MAKPAMSCAGACRPTVVAVGKCCRERKKSGKDATDQPIAIERLATRGSAHGRFLGNVKTILAIDQESIQLSHKTDAPCPSQTQPHLNRK